MVELLLKSDLESVIKSIGELNQKIDGLIQQTELASVYTNETLAKELKVSKRTLQDWRDSGKINFSKVGRRIFYRRQDVEMLLFESNNKLFDEEFGSRKSKKKGGNP